MIPAPIQRTRDGILERLNALRFAEDAALVEGLPAADKVQAILEDLVEEGLAVRFSAGLYAHPKAVSEAKETLAKQFPEGFTASQAREHLGTNRKLAIPFLEYLDTQGFTKRQGDVRVLTVALS
ncbi:Selenocysteine-specific elongation factor [compost metagenome]